VVKTSDSSKCSINQLYLLEATLSWVILGRTKLNKCAIAQLFPFPVSFAKGRFTVPFEVDLRPLDLLLPLLSPVALPCFGQTNQEIRRSGPLGDIEALL